MIDGEPSTAAYLRREDASLNKWLLTIFGLVVTLTFDLLISKSNQFIFVSKCTWVVTLVKAHKRFMRHRVNKHTHRLFLSDSLKTACFPRLIAGKGINISHKITRSLVMICIIIAVEVRSSWHVPRSRSEERSHSFTHSLSLSRDFHITRLTNGYHVSTLLSLQLNVRNKL